MTARVTAVGGRMWKRLGLAFLVMLGGLGLAFVGLASDFYQHEIVGLDPGDESLLSPVHLAIFIGIAITGLGFLIAHRALKREGHTPFTMMAG